MEFFADFVIPEIRRYTNWWFGPFKQILEIRCNFQVLDHRKVKKRVIKIVWLYGIYVKYSTIINGVIKKYSIEFYLRFFVDSWNDTLHW